MTHTACMKQHRLNFSDGMDTLIDLEHDLPCNSHITHQGLAGLDNHQACNAAVQQRYNVYLDASCIFTAELTSYPIATASESSMQTAIRVKEQGLDCVFVRTSLVLLIVQARQASLGSHDQPCHPVHAQAEGQDVAGSTQGSRGSCSWPTRSLCQHG